MGRSKCKMKERERDEKGASVRGLGMVGKWCKLLGFCFFVFQFYFFNYWVLFNFVTLIKKIVSFFEKKLEKLVEKKGGRGHTCERTGNGGKVVQVKVFFFVLQFYFFNYWVLFNFVTSIENFESFFHKKTRNISWI